MFNQGSNGTTQRPLNLPPAGARSLPLDAPTAPLLSRSACSPSACLGRHAGVHRPACCCSCHWRWWCSGGRGPLFSLPSRGRAMTAGTRRRPAAQISYVHSRPPQNSSSVRSASQSRRKQPIHRVGVVLPHRLTDRPTRRNRTKSLLFR